MSYVFTNILADAVPSLSVLAKPMDGGVQWRGKPIFGPSRTFLGIIFTCITFVIWGLLVSDWVLASSVFLVLLGTLVSSFIKRRLGYARGEHMFIVDQADYMILVGVFAYYFGFAPMGVILLSIVITIILQPIVSYIGYKLGWKKLPY
jgi:CDP-2,3-bis-(O-geranylgeranyl)-sn-glycerol synthase